MLALTTSPLPGKTFLAKVSRSTLVSLYLCSMTLSVSQVPVL